MDAHVVGDKVEDEPDVGRGERRAETIEGGSAAELRIERAVVDYIVAMGASGARLQNGRSVEVADAERPQIRNDSGGVVEPEGRRELEPVGCERDYGRHQTAPMLQYTPHAGRTLPGSPPQTVRLD